MKSLYLIRHAKSSKEDATLLDFDRPLHSKGQEEAAQMATMLKARGIQPDLLISSPAERAISTAQLFAEVFHYPNEKIELEFSLYDAEKSAIYDVIHHLDNSNNSVFIFGHNPEISLFVDGFTEGLASNVPTCGVALFTLESEDWKKFNPKHACFVKVLSPNDIS